MGEGSKEGGVVGGETNYGYLFAIVIIPVIAIWLGRCGDESMAS